jgi:hypothetical protein
MDEDKTISLQNIEKYSQCQNFVFSLKVPKQKVIKPSKFGFNFFQMFLMLKTLHHVVILPQWDYGHSSKHFFPFQSRGIRQKMLKNAPFSLFFKEKKTISETV